MIVFVTRPMADSVEMAAQGILMLEINPGDEGVVAGWLKLQKPDAKLKNEMKLWRKDRTLPQNALFHAIVGEIAAETGMDFEIVKAGLKEQYCPKLAVPRSDGGMSLIPKPTHLLDTKEMGRIIDGALAEAAFLGINTQPFIAERNKESRYGD